MRIGKPTIDNSQWSTYCSALMVKRMMGDLIGKSTIMGLIAWDGDIVLLID